MQEVVSNIESRVSHQQLKAGMESVKSDLTRNLASELAKLHSRNSNLELDAELYSLRQKIDDTLRAVALQSPQDLEERLSEKANKQSVAQALHRKCNKQDLEEALQKKVDFDDFHALMS